MNTSTQIQEANPLFNWPGVQTAEQSPFQSHAPIVFKPSLPLFRMVKAGFIIQGVSLTSWCRKRDINPANARSVLTGNWDGPKAKALRKRLMRAAGLVPQ